MTIEEKIKKLKKSKEAASEKKDNAEADKQKGRHNCEYCGGFYYQAKISLIFEGGQHWQDVCYRRTCIKCGHTKRVYLNGAPKLFVYWWEGFGKPLIDYEQFNVPRELVVDVKRCTSGEILKEADGSPKLVYNKDKKIEFVKKLLSLVDWKSRFNQDFTVKQVMAAQPQENADNAQSDAGNAQENNAE
ncbi:hypothetical protein Dip510_000839 [Elusimicrobium posterum]|uniref:hypothetical protein n=1 Tax=Elusimicrobium posterum TaxID=3116653 RepID=UPI003C71A46E